MVNNQTHCPIVNVIAAYDYIYTFFDYDYDYSAFGNGNYDYDCLKTCNLLQPITITEYDYPNIAINAS